MPMRCRTSLTRRSHRALPTVTGSSSFKGSAWIVSKSVAVTPSHRATSHHVKRHRHTHPATRPSDATVFSCSRVAVLCGHPRTYRGRKTGVEEKRHADSVPVNVVDNAVRCALVQAARQQRQEVADVDHQCTGHGVSVDPLAACTLDVKTTLDRGVDVQQCPHTCAGSASGVRRQSARPRHTHGTLTTINTKIDQSSWGEEPGGDESSAVSRPLQWRWDRR